MQPSIVIKQGTGAAQVIQSGMVSVPMTVSSSMAGSIPNMMALNKAGGQNVLVSSQNLGAGQQAAILPNVQILNMRPGAPAVGVQKSVATVSPRVVIGSPQVVGARPPAPGQIACVGTSVAQMTAAGTAMPQTLHQPPAPAPAAAPSTYVKPADNTKEKCRNFLANLLDLSSKEPPSVEMNVRTLIQELIDAKVEPEEFCERLERLLNASPQPCLIGFLKKSLPLLRQSLVTKELTIEGIFPPAPHVAFSIVNTPAPMAVMAASTHQMKPTPKPGNTIAVLQNIPVQTKMNVNKASSGKGMAASKSNVQRAATSTVIAPGKSLLKERRSTTQFAAQQYSDDKMAGDDDINDVAAMGGVNLAEETQRILGSTEMIGTQIRSCKEHYLVDLSAMQARVKSITAKHGLEDSPPEVAGLLTHALHERLKTIVEKLAVIAQHRIDNIKTDEQYEVSQDVKGQLKFLEDLDRVNKKRREDSEREILLRAAKSRSKNEDPEQAKLKAKAKEMQRAELEELRQREANVTALQAIGPRKKPRVEGAGGAGDSLAPTASTTGAAGLPGRSQLALRSRLKRITQRDMMFMLETDRDTAHSLLLYKSYLK